MYSQSGCSGSGEVCGGVATRPAIVWSARPAYHVNTLRGSPSLSPPPPQAAAAREDADCGSVSALLSVGTISWGFRRVGHSGVLRTHSGVQSFNWRTVLNKLSIK